MAFRNQFSVLPAMAARTVNLHDRRPRRSPADNTGAAERPWLNLRPMAALPGERAAEQAADRIGAATEPATTSFWARVLSAGLGRHAADRGNQWIQG